MELIKKHSKTLTTEEIRALYPLVNDCHRGTYVDETSWQFVDKIIELWFEEQGYDFWDNPYPDVVEWEITKDNNLVFSYILN